VFLRDRVLTLVLMKDNTYYKIMNWLGWTVIALGLMEVTLYALGYYPEFKWSRLASPSFALNILLMVRMMKQKDEIIETQEEIIERQEEIIDTLRK